MRSLWLVLGFGPFVAGCWVTNAEVREKVLELDEGAESGDTGDAVADEPSDGT